MTIVERIKNASPENIKLALIFIGLTDEQTAINALDIVEG
jgi:hypothetical protein